MNSLSPLRRITSYEELQHERSRLEALIQHQKYVIRQDLDDLKNEIRREVRPALEAASFVKKLTTRETRNETVMHIGSAMLIDLLMRKLLSRSGIFIRLVVPAVMKNYSSHLLSGLIKKAVRRH